MDKKNISLPAPRKDGSISVEAAIAARRSRRKFTSKQLSLEIASQVLWAAGGQTGAKPHFRSFASAGACHPLTILVVTGENTVEGVAAGLYKYLHETHELQLIRKGDIRPELTAACLGQKFLETIPMAIAVYAEYEKSTKRYEDRGFRYSHIDLGHLGQNVYLQCEALGLGTVAVGAFTDNEVAGVLGLGEKQSPLYVMPVGYPEIK